MNESNINLTSNQIILLEYMYKNKDVEFSFDELRKINTTKNDDEIYMLERGNYIKSTVVESYENDPNSEIVFFGHFVPVKFMIAHNGVVFYENYRYKVALDKETIDIAHKAIVISEKANDISTTANAKSGKANTLGIIAIIISTIVGLFEIIKFIVPIVFNYFK